MNWEDTRQDIQRSINRVKDGKARIQLKKMLTTLTNQHKELSKLEWELSRNPRNKTLSENIISLRSKLDEEEKIIMKFVLMGKLSDM